MEVETLFQTRSIAAVREVETQTRHEIEEKKRQLRQVVGDSYRDLISSADTIIDISRSCHKLVGLTASLQEGLGQLAGAVEARQAAAAAEPAAAAAASSYDRLYALGSRIKYLIDTPEMIYGCLDSREHLAAARRYVRAAEVHRVLTAGQAKQVAQRFPLLQHQWPLVKKFRPQVYKAADAWLASHGELSAAQAAATLAAQALLKPMDGAEVLKAFLTARQAYIMQCLSQATSSASDTDLDSLACILADVATMVCATLAQCGELFLQLPGVSATPLLLAALAAEDGTSADLLFDTGKEAEAWKAHVEAARSRLAELSAAGLALECSQWLDQLSQALRQLGGRLLGPCSSGQGLLSVEAAVKAALEEWQYMLQASSPAPAADPGAAPEPEAPVSMAWADICQWVLGRPSPLWPLLFEQPLLERAKQLVQRDFGGVVEEVTGLLSTALEEAATLPPSAPGSFQASTWSEVVDLQPASPAAAAAGPVGNSKRRRMGPQPKPATVGRPAGSPPGALLQAWLPRAERVVQTFDQQLSKALAAALDACGSRGVHQAGVGGDAAGAVGAAVQRRASGLSEPTSSRALVLEPFVQDRCAEAVEGIAAALDDRLQALPKAHGAESAAEREAAAAAYAPYATQALVLGRVALGMANRSSMLPVVLGPPDQWRAATAGPNGGSADAGAGSRALLGPAWLPVGPVAAAAAAAATPSARFERLQQQLQNVGLQAYGCWAEWASEGLAAVLVAGLAGDHTLAADAPLRSWEETVIGGGGSGGSASASLDPEELAMMGGGGDTGAVSLEMRFQLPAAPSPAVVQLALAACQEADRAGGHLLEDEPLLLFKWRLGGSVLTLLGAALADSASGGTAGLDGAGRSVLAGGRLSEKGLLQLLFDVRFLLDLLSGGRPVRAGAHDAAGSAAAVAARRREVSQLEGQLSARLDPIDWATYEPYLYANKERAATRSQVLYGMLLRSDRAQQAGMGAAAAATGVPTDSNILRMAPVGPRFSYLPVTMPASLMRQTSASASMPHPLPHAGGSGAALGDLPRATSALLAAGVLSPGAAAGAAGAEVSAGTYSFASLLAGGKAVGAGRQGGEDGSGGVGGAAASASSAAAEHASSAANKLLGSLQGLIGDASFGDMGTQGLLSTFARFNK